MARKKYSQPAKKVQLVGKKSFLWFRGFCTIFLLLTTPYVMFESKKTQILIAHQKEGIDRTQKSTAIRQKKFGQGLEHFVRVFGKLTTPSVMFLKQKLKFLLLIRRKIQIEPKKVQLSGKKSFLWFRGFRMCFWEVDHPLCDVL